MTPVDVMIPMRDNITLTNAVVTSLLADGEHARLRIYDNGSVEWESRRWLDAPPDGVEVVRWSAKRGVLYSMWNASWQWCLDAQREMGEPRYLAILNNDLTLPAGFLGHLARALDSADDDTWITYPDWKRPLHAGVDVTGELVRTRGTRNSGGMSGYAFLLDVRRHDTHGLPFIPEAFRWYSGDGALITDVERRGGCAARVVGLPIFHAERATSRNHQWTSRARAQDRATFRRLYG